MLPCCKVNENLPGEYGEEGGREMGEELLGSIM